MEHLRITVEGKVYEVVVERIDDKTDENQSAIPAVQAPSPTTTRAKAAAAPTPEPTATGPGDAVSPLAGIVQSVAVAVGDTVAEGDLILTLEAMKMYTPINAVTAGTIKKIHAKAGDAVDEGQALYTLA